MSLSDPEAVTLDLKVTLRADGDFFVVKVTLASVNIIVERRSKELRKALRRACIDCAEQLRAQDWDTTPQDVLQAIESAIETGELVMRDPAN